MSSILSLLVLLVSALWAARRIVAFVLPTASSDRASRVAAFGTVSVAWCLVATHLLGSVSELFDATLVRMPLIAALSVVGAAALAIARRKRPVGNSQEFSSDPERPAYRVAPTSRVWLVALVPVAVLHAGLIFDAALRPPTSFDGLYYHLPLMFEWLHGGRLELVPEVWKFCLPANSELWQMLFASTGIEPLIDLSMAPIGVLLATIVLATALQLGAGSTGARLAALFTLACPIVALQMYSSYTDLFGTTFLMGGLYWLIRLARSTPQPRQRIACAALAGLSLGVAVGTKFQFLAWTACLLLLAAIIFVVQIRMDRTGNTAPPALRLWPLALLATLPLAATFWYFRSYYHTGWPLYPLQVRIAGHVFGSGVPLEGATRDIRVPLEGLSALLYPWFESKYSGYNYSVGNGLGPQFAVFAVLGAVYFLARRPLFATCREQLAKWVMLGFIGCGIAMFFTVLHLPPRYGLPLWVAAFAASAALAGVLSRLAPRSTTVLAGVTLTLAAAMIGLWPAKLLLGRVRDGALSRAKTYEMPELFDRLPRGTVVLNLGPHGMNYPLLGADRQNRVIDTMRVLHHRERGRLQLPLSAHELDELAIEYVFTRGASAAPFSADVTYETVYDDERDPSRVASTAPTRVYRVLRPRFALKGPS